MLSSNPISRLLALGLCAATTLISTACVAVVPHTPQTDLVAESSLDQVAEEFRKVTTRATAPIIRSVEVEGDTVRLEAAQNMQWGAWWTGGMVNQGQFSIYLPVLSRAEVYENNKVFLYQNENQRFLEILFGNPQDPIRFVDLLFSLKAADEGAGDTDGE